MKTEIEKQADFVFENRGTGVAASGVMPVGNTTYTVNVTFKRMIDPMEEAEDAEDIATAEARRNEEEESMEEVFGRLGLV